MRSIAIREELTDEWKDHGVGEHREYATLTAEISKAAFGLTPSEYADVKGRKLQSPPRPQSGASVAQRRRHRRLIAFNRADRSRCCCRALAWRQIGT